MPAESKPQRPKRTKGEVIAGRAFERAFKLADSGEDQQEAAIIMAWVHGMIRKGEEPNPDLTRAIKNWWPFLAEVFRQLDPPRGRHASHPIAEGNRELIRWNHEQMVKAYKTKNAALLVRSEYLLDQALREEFRTRRFGDLFSFAPKKASGYVASGDRSEEVIREAQAFLDGVVGSFMDRISEILAQNGMTYDTYRAIIRKTNRPV